MRHGMRWLLISKILLTRCGPLDHTNLPLFLRYFTSINMVIFFVALAVSAACARFLSIIVARFWRMMVVWRLILATKVAFVMVVRVMVALSVVVVATIATARLAIFGVVTALLVCVLGLVAMDVARFRRKLRQGFSLELVAFEVTAARWFVTVIAIAIIAIIATA
jgi:hypothetical protein